MDLKLKNKIKNRRKADYNRFIAAFLITFLIFISSFLLGMYVDNNKYEKVKSIVEKQDLDFESLQLQYLFLQNSNNNTCNVTSIILENNVKILSPILNKILDYEKSKEKDSEEYYNLLRRYNIYNTRYFLLAEKSRKECDNDIITILYFFNDECKVCPEQGYILSGFKNILKERFLVFPYNIDMKNKDFTVEMLYKSYNITKYPTLIINGEKRIEGFIDREGLKNVVCNEYKEKPYFCNYNFKENNSEKIVVKG